MAPVLNLNNEVVKMRKDVKKVKVLTIRKLTRNISKLKSKKGTEELIQKNQRRAQRLLEEIHTIKKLRPDDVTKIALQKEINFEKVCKKPNSTVETRAVARLATHPLLNKKISTIKDAIKAFKEARINAEEQEDKSEETSKPDEPAQIAKTNTKKQCKDKTKQNRKPEATKPEATKPEATKPEATKPEATKPEAESLHNLPCKRIHEETDLVACNQRYKEDALGSQNGQKPASLSVPKVSPERKLVEVVPEKPASLTTPKVSAERKPGAGVPKKQALENKIENKSRLGKKTPVNESGSDSSDIEDSDKEDKEYFDDSTEERFYKQSSGFEDSDSDGENDFFIGKVRRTKKRKSSKNSSEDKVEKEKLPTDTTKPSAGGRECQKGNSAPKTAKLESVFCSSLSDTKRKSSFMKRETKLPPVWSKTAVVPQAPKLVKKPQAARNSAWKSQSKPETALHPSWEASKKRKEQSQIAVFQGKKIVFDD
ncbi:PREDICTED: serum response factor-binding protein 1 [Nanorana parkeri]|uniref:serum response factor-binding protein 1 n=1 Tax=Nanorana parkeri TaxID=125878 RepID=UPI00085500E5|nr:PREDICTED: serum response factor-binding protein 1 [Nanorana parkeri]